MRLDPIYLLAPEPDDEPTTYSRRSVFAFAALALGLGFAAGTGLARVLRAPKAPETTDDPELAWAVGLCEGPIGELVAYRHTLLEIGARRPEDVARIESGLIRLADHVLTGNAPDPDRSVMARELVAFIQRLESRAPDSLQGRAKALSRLFR